MNGNEKITKAMDEYATFMLGGESLAPELKRELEQYDAKGGKYA